MPLTPAKPALNPRLIQHFKRRFNCDFIIQVPTDVPDGAGGSTRNWAPWVGPANGEVLGALYELSALEREQQGAAGEATTHQLLIAYVAGVDATMRVLYGTRIFDIGHVIDYGEQHLLLELECIERFRK